MTDTPPFPFDLDHIEAWTVAGLADDAWFARHPHRVFRLRAPASGEREFLRVEGSTWVTLACRFNDRLLVLEVPPAVRRRQDDDALLFELWKFLQDPEDPPEPLARA